VDSQKVLSGWKDIANYTGKGVRTIQRWEKDFGFPVRRPGGEGRNAIIALPNEIDAWVHKQSLSDPGELDRLRDENGRLRVELRSCHDTIDELRSTEIPRARRSNMCRGFGDLGARAEWGRKCVRSHPAFPARHYFPRRGKRFKGNTA
jgi:hypothetical protein